MADNANPGNFANRPKEEVQAAAQKGGQSSTTGGFASMDPDKQVRLQYPSDIITSFPCPSNTYNRKTLHPREDRQAAVHSNLEARRRRRLVVKVANLPSS